MTSIQTGRSSRRAWTIAGVAALFVLAILALMVVSLGNDPRADNQRLENKAAPRFLLNTVDGQVVDSAELLGGVVIVNFWNSWCVPCRQEHPDLVKFYDLHASDPDFTMVGIVRDDSESAVREFLVANQTPWIIAFDPDARASLDFGTFGQPETYAIDADGIVRASFFGPASVADLEQMLTKARLGEQS
ncbi:MAG: TlpA family protein disulfide reductase [Actinobacteria bacterium]|nr:TlpA family protein disulfide reductase [Actinomycetota bacterium]MCB9388385.1 TlpA family protein disulfide reductase [Acidimicrobiia bacterium]